jgi:hypothetical protein
MKNKLVFRTCDKHGKSRNDFQWNLAIGGITTAPDWKETTECGNGLHGFLNGEGDGSLADWSSDAIWMVIEPIGKVIDLDGKVKFESGKTIFVGDRLAATNYLYSQIGLSAIVGGTSTSGDNGTSTSGYKGTSTSGDYSTSTSRNYGTSTSGNKGTSTSGYYGTSTSGDKGTSTSGDYGTSTSEYNGTSTSGYKGTSTSGDYGTSTSGNKGTSTSGDKGTSTSGDYGTSTSGNKGTSTSGYKGTILIKYWCKNSNRYKVKIGYIGENELKSNTPYRLDESNEFVEVVDLINANNE